MQVKSQTIKYQESIDNAISETKTNLRVLKNHSDDILEDITKLQIKLDSQNPFTNQHLSTKVQTVTFLESQE